MKNHKTSPAALIALVVLCSCISALVLGQGGDPRKKNTNSSTTRTSKKATTTKKAPAKKTTPSTPQPVKPRQTAPEIEMVLVPAGTFTMGSPDSEVRRHNDEGPQHQVRVPSFYMGKYEITQAQYQAVMGTNPSQFKGDNLPVESVSWNGAVEFCRKLSQMTGKKYRLPSEAEWEYACRAGTETPFAFGSTLSSEQANFNGRYPYGGAPKRVYRAKTTPVGSFQPNAFGLYDMHGNVWEWCEDWYHDNYNGAPTDGSAWLSGGEQKYRVLRGGSWPFVATDLRSASRLNGIPDYRRPNDGFRVVEVARTQLG